ncbi:DUF4185 domain-containing protein [Gordonia sp. NPDC003504]
MNRRRIGPTRVVACALAVSATMVGASLLATGTAAASPCGNGSSGSSGSSGSLDLGSLGLGSGSSSNPSTGPQGALPYYRTDVSRTVAWVTGPRSPNLTFSRFTISGTDLGVSWDNGDGQTLMAFGDTFGDCSATGQQWRHNVLLRTNDTNLADGITVPAADPNSTTSGSVVTADRPTYAQQLISAVGFQGVEVTTIPTAAISLPKPDGPGFRQYMNYMSVRSWGSAGNWVTNFSAIAYSDDNGQTWTTDTKTILINAPVDFELPEGWRPLDTNNGKFQQNAYFRGHGADSEWVYQLGTPNGRFGAAFLARFHPNDILDLDKYQYWTGTGDGWVDTISEIPEGTSQIVPSPVTEASVSWSPYLNKYIMLDGDNGIRIRTADKPEGPWSSAFTLVEPGAVVLYGPMMLPQSPALTGSGKDLYFNASRWSDYNVMLVRSDLSKVPK